MKKLISIALVAITITSCSPSKSKMKLERAKIIPTTSITTIAKLELRYDKTYKRVTLPIENEIELEDSINAMFTTDSDLREIEVLFTDF